MNNTQFYLFGQIQTSQAGGQPYSDTSPYGECSAEEVSLCLMCLAFFIEKYFAKIRNLLELRKIVFICTASASIW